MAPDLLQALRKDLAEVASCALQVAHCAVPVNSKTGVISKESRKFAGEIGPNLGATLTERPGRGGRGSRSCHPHDPKAPVFRWLLGILFRSFPTRMQHDVFRMRTILRNAY